MTRKTKMIMAGLLAAFFSHAATHAVAGPCQLQRMVAPDAFGSVSFGNSVAQWEDYWFVADFRANSLCPGSPFSCSAGAVYVYQMVGEELEYRQTLVSSFPQVADQYGISIAAEGGRLVVGAPAGSWPGRTDRPGAVFVYNLIGGLWIETAAIEPTAEARAVGIAVDIQGQTLIAADRDRDTVLVYMETAEGWELVQEIFSPSPPAAQRIRFGHTLAIDGPWMVIGAYSDRSRLANGGSAHLYRTNAEGEYVLEQSIYSEEAARLGQSVSIEGVDLYLGAPLTSRRFVNQGIVHHYTLQGSGWVFANEILSVQEEDRLGFGTSLFQKGDQLLVQAEKGIGSGYAFQRSHDGNWRQFTRIVPDTTMLAMGFGRGLVSDGRFLLVGAPNERVVFGDDPFGAAYLFDLDCLSDCPDLDADGRLTIYDFLLFQNLFAVGDLAANFDGDGELTALDFLAFQTAFAAGCE